MKKLVFILLAFPILLVAQKSEQFVGKGLLSAKGTLALGQMTAFDETNMYVSANSEYFVEDNVSFRGGFYFFLGADHSNSKNIFAQNSTLFWGYSYHFKTNNHLDPYVGFLPGLSLTQLKAPDNKTKEPYPYNVSTYPMTVSPVASANIGINYYATRFTHLFVEATYVDGVHLSDISGVSLSEFRVAFGFGFNVWTIKKK